MLTRHKWRMQRRVLWREKRFAHTHWRGSEREIVAQASELEGRCRVEADGGECGLCAGEKQWQKCNNERL